VASPVCVPPKGSLEDSGDLGGDERDGALGEVVGLAGRERLARSGDGLAAHDGGRGGGCGVVVVEGGDGEPAAGPADHRGGTEGDDLPGDGHDGHAARRR